MLSLNSEEEEEGEKEEEKEEKEEEVQEIKIKSTTTTLLKDLNSSSPSLLFPSSSSSTFVPPSPSPLPSPSPPPLSSFYKKDEGNQIEIDIVSKLDKRIMIEKEKRETAGKDDEPMSLNPNGEGEGDGEGDGEEIIYDVTPTPLSPLFPVHPVLHPDPNNLPPLDLDLNLNLNNSTSLEESESIPDYFTPTTTLSSSSTTSFNSTKTNFINPTNTTTTSSLPSNSFIFIRDFAFLKEDPRFNGGKHPDQDLKKNRNNYPNENEDEDDQDNNNNNDNVEGESREERVSPKVGNEDFSTSGSSGCKLSFFLSGDHNQYQGRDTYTDSTLGYIYI